MRYSQCVIAPMAVLILAACGGGSDSGTNTEPPPPGTNPPSGSPSVAANGSSDVFTPSDVKISVGGTVTWSFGARAHNAVFASVSGAPAHIPVTANAQVSRTFNSEGTFPYDCTLHPGMRGRVLVGNTDGASPPGY
jgi:plastocyanin